MGLEKWTRPTALAVREVTAFWVMLTMCASPVGVRWVSLGCSEDVGGVVVLVEYARAWRKDGGGNRGGISVLENEELRIKPEKE